MKQDNKILAVIPARGGSKRLPRKNVLELGGKPMIQWSIDAAHASKYISKIVVSTDNEEIAGLCEELEIDLLWRPDYLSTDKAKSDDVLIHAIKSMQGKYNFVILLQPTSPLRTTKDIDMAIELLFEKKADAIISVCETEHSPLWSNTLPKNGNMNDFINKSVKGKRSQDLPSYYRLNGAIYIYDIEKLLSERSMFFNNNTFSYVMDRKKSIDIDEQIDLEFARLLMQTECNN